MKFSITVFLFLLIIIFSCKKSEKNGPPVETKITYTVDSASTLPGLFLTLKANSAITRDTCTVQLGDKSVFLVKTDSFHYSFLVPVFTPGTYILDLKNINASSNPNVIIRNYTPIVKPDEVISGVINNYNNLADSLAKYSLDSAVTSSDATFMHQLMDQLTQNIQTSNDEDKLSLAYQLQNMNLDSSFAKNANLDTTYLISAFTGGAEDDPGSEVLYKVIDAEKAKIKAVLSVGGVIVTGAAVLKSGNVYAAGSFLIAFGIYVYSINSARKAAAEAVDITGIAEDDVSEVNGNGTSVNPIVISAGNLFTETLITTFRTLRISDEVDELIEDIKEFIKGTNELQEKDNSILTIFIRIKNLFGNFFNKITIPYTAYISPVLETAKEKLARIKNQFVSVTNVSDPDITITATDDGTNGLKLTFDNPAKNITTETNFTFQLTYSQDAINNKVAITEQAKFIIGALPSVTTTILNSITSTSASSGGIITNDGGSAIISKGVCYGTDPNPIPDILNTVPGGSGTGSFISNITGLQPGIKYYVRAFASNNAGIGYGDDLSFTTLDFMTVLVSHDWRDWVNSEPPNPYNLLTFYNDGTGIHTSISDGSTCPITWNLSDDEKSFNYSFGGQCGGVTYFTEVISFSQDTIRLNDQGNNILFIKN